MYTAVTNHVKVTVEPSYDSDRSEPDESLYFWRYAVEIANLGATAVTLIDRHWVITDANGQRREVRGPGVVGEQPTLNPGQAFRYVSGCPLTTPSGVMVGSFRMIDEAGGPFDVAIPAFSLDSPSGARTLN